MLRQGFTGNHVTKYTVKESIVPKWLVETTALRVCRQSLPCDHHAPCVPTNCRHRRALRVHPLKTGSSRRSCYSVPVPKKQDRREDRAMSVPTKQARREDRAISVPTKQARRNDRAMSVKTGSSRRSCYVCSQKTGLSRRSCYVCSHKTGSSRRSARVLCLLKTGSSRRSCFVCSKKTGSSRRSCYVCSHKTGSRRSCYASFQKNRIVATIVLCLFPRPALVPPGRTSKHPRRAPLSPPTNILKNAILNDVMQLKTS
jgi:hypothetical protein